MFSIIIPTFNNLDYLKLCLKSLKKNSNYEHDIIIFINEGNDGTLTYVKDNNLKFLHSDINKGVCYAFNQSAKIAKRGKEKYMKYFNSTIVADYIINNTFDISYNKNKYMWENK